MSERYIPKVGDKFTFRRMNENGVPNDGLVMVCRTGPDNDNLLQTEDGIFLYCPWYNFTPYPGFYSESATVATTLEERGRNYGDYKYGSVIAQGLKDEMRKAPGFCRLSPYQQYSLEMFQNKIARILNGDPNYVDSWLDIAGYAQLVVDQLNGKNT